MGGPGSGPRPGQGKGKKRKGSSTTRTISRKIGGKMVSTPMTKSQIRKSNKAMYALFDSYHKHKKS
jgi:hypothetical protein